MWGIEAALSQTDHDGLCKAIIVGDPKACGKHSDSSPNPLLREMMLHGATVHYVGASESLAY